jgi:hypothetical protein
MLFLPWRYLFLYGPRQQVREFLKEDCDMTAIEAKGKCTEYIAAHFFYGRHSTLRHLPPLRFYCVGGCWDRTHVHKKSI